MLNRHQTFRFHLAVLPFAVLLATPTAVTAQHIHSTKRGIEGFTSPYRVLNIAAPEAGIVEELLVREGDRVEKGDILARLDNDVHKALLEIAKASMELRGKIKATQAELDMRRHRFRTLVRIHESGHAPQEEVDRARADVEVSEGNLLSAHEQVLLKQLEYDKIQAQIARRIIRAPLTGVVTSLVKQQGEFAAPNDPDLLVLVQLDPLLADFAVSRKRAADLKLGMNVKIELEESGARVQGVVEFISPLTDAESNTVSIKIRIDNPDGKYHSGEHCFLKPLSK